MKRPRDVVKRWGRAKSQLLWEALLGIPSVPDVAIKGGSVGRAYGSGVVPRWRCSYGRACVRSRP